MSTTRTLAAGLLRQLAEALDTTGFDLPIRVSVNINPGYDPRQASRVATVDALSALLGLTAGPATNAGGWYHEARDERDGVRLWVYTYIDAPAQHCACGAVCTHTPATGRAA